MSDNPRPLHLTAKGWIRAVGGGGSEPHLFQTEDGEYVVKARNNKQGSLKVLANELVGGLCLDYLDVKHPQSAIVEIPAEVIDDSPGARYSDGVPIKAGNAFGSKHWQSDPLGAIDANLVLNKEDVGGTLVYDTWVQNHDGRQYRVRASADEPGKYEAFPVDQGYSMGNPNWTRESLRADMHNMAVPPSFIPVTRQHIQLAIDRLRRFGRAQANHIVNEVPDDWLSTEEKQALADYLMERASEAADALEASYPLQGGE